MRKKIYCFAAMLLVVSMISPMVFNVAAQTESSISPFKSWEPPKDFVDPVTLKIQELKAQGLGEEEITGKLKELGMGWYPKTGATWIGRTLTPEELADMPSRSPAESLLDGNTISTYTGRTSCMRTSDDAWTGVGADMVSGDMNRDSEETILHYICVQLGELNSASNWAEIVLTHDLGEDYEWNTYDNDEGEWAYYMDKDTAITAVDCYVIMLDGTYDENEGWNYDVWINYEWVRSGHLDNIFVQAGFQKEVYSDTGQFTDDTSRTEFYPTWRHDGMGWNYWQAGTWWSTADPVKEYHYAVPWQCWSWQTWVEN
jgi:hypothetical protein